MRSTISGGSSLLTREGGLCGVKTLQEATPHSSLLKGRGAARQGKKAADEGSCLEAQARRLGAPL